MAIIPRYTNNCNNYDDDCNYDGNSPWYNYGRWIVLAIVIIGAFLIFVIFSCFTARRRRRLGHSPYRGTGWAAGPPPGHGPAQYTGAPPQPYLGNENHAPPVYSPPVSNQGYYNQGHGQNQGYFGGQQQGVELQQPQSAYTPQRGGEAVYDYAPPVGPPPGQKSGDGIIR